MKIKYIAQEKSIEINDGLKTSYLIIGFLMLLNIFNAVINLYKIKDGELNMIGYIWIFVGAISIGAVVYVLLKKTTLKKIPLDQIKRLKEKQILGRKRFSLELQNGKLRDLIKLGTQSDIKELKKMFNDIGIETD
ncbi:hypothetical protein Celal_0231 [Cellulophaga algicola DSM 14237]|uniref:Uncharacterized protein n=1 Tax=Cellulophaga algicola (strain DSM 14237 / IC166 / ACAM 630) TaxID=688270 RepID=E6X8I7_CELAD|nr:hypothetical protein [Cellulophaga algicola]ADV47574.1 hypothetical protein Celal_0224 [Cellulophaga algicola DSM 14237]ADV47581.1 hypothetical protein Celal_0231 [Cellulophaga algicola DSM 14237]